MVSIAKYKPLIFNEDIKLLEKKQSPTLFDAELMRHKGFNEHKVQTLAKNYFDSLNHELEIKNIGQVFFFQIDNGANGAGAGAKIRKWQEGTRPAMSDVCILVWSVKKQQHKCWFVEFKRIETENYICGNQKTTSGLKTYIRFQKQLAMQEKLRKMGCAVHLTNNLLYCREVIGAEIREFLK